MPGRVWYWVAGGIGAMALVAFVAILFNGIDRGTEIGSVSFVPPARQVSRHVPLE